MMESNNKKGKNVVDKLEHNKTQSHKSTHYSQNKPSSSPKKKFKDILRKKESENNIEQPVNDSKQSCQGISPFELFTNSISSKNIAIENIDSMQLQEVYELLCEKITFMQDNGIETLSVTFQSDGALNGMEIHFTFYDTAPSSFHIQLEGTSDMLTILNNQTVSLQKAMQAQFPDNPIHIPPPQLLDELRFRQKHSEKKELLIKQKRERAPKIKPLK